ncbi:MAG: DUF3667 domain-containing protein [Chthoniobacterales bacterium]
MSDETPLILGDALVAELDRPRRRRWLRGKMAPLPPLTHCENCGSALTGRYCAQCGQPAIDYRRSFPSLLADAADAFFNFDARYFQSFAWLLVKPWRLTNEFIEGKRARHVHPLRVYLIASVIFFLVVNYLAKDSHLQTKTEGDQANFGIVRGTPVAGPSVASTPTPLATVTPAASARPRFSLDLRDTQAAREKRGFAATFDNADNKPGLGGWIERRAREKLGPTGDRGDLFLRGVIQNLAPMVLCCIPLFALVLKILYVFKRRFYIEHLVFALHTHAFIFLSTVIIIGIGFLLALQSTVLTAVFCPLLSCVVIVQLLFAIRRVYRQNWFATIVKFLLGSWIYCVLLSLAFGITAAVTLVLP